MPIGFNAHPKSVLPDNHWRALYAAAAELVDVLCTDIVDLETGTPFAELAITDYLPRAYLPRYTPVFLRQFLVVMVSVGLKLRQPGFWPPECVAEELALHVLVEYATGLLDLAGEAADFDAWTDVALEDTDIELLYEPRLDGVQDSPVGRDLGLANLGFAAWFVPFRQPHTLHPYVAAEDADLLQHDPALFEVDDPDA